MNIHGKSRYHEVHARSLADPEGFWAEAAREIDWIEPAKKVFDASSGAYGRWFTGGVVNTCHNALDRHVAGGRADQVALIHDSPLTGSITKFTYAELLHEVKTLAAIMQDFGVAKGDRVILYMPMVPEAVVAMLACARIGAVHSVVFGGFAAKELATRIDDAKPKLIFSASCGIEPGRIVQYKPLLDEAIQLASTKPSACIVLQRPQQACDLAAGRDHDWAALRKAAIAANKSADCVPVLATDPLYILYTSGTTGIPKGVVRDNGGHLVALKWSMFNLYGVKPGDIWWCGSDIGWVVGHSYIVYGPLLHGATSIMYEGKPVGTPDAGAFWRVISEHKAVAFFTAPTAFRAIKKEDPEGKFIRKYDLSKFRTLFLAGERADPPTVEWAEQQLKVPVIDHWWQTETGWCIAGNPVGLGMLPIKHGSPTVPMPGYQVDVVDEAAKPVPANTMGSIVIKLPMPPACLPTLWQQDDRFKEAYLTEFPGYYKTSDAGYKDEDGYVWVMGRTDDIINVAGHRLSTGGMEEILASHPDVAECAVLGIKDAIKGEVPCGFLVLGDQLDGGSAAFDGFDAARDAVLMMEVRFEATYIPQHKRRIAFFFAAMRHFRDEQRAAGRTVLYVELDDPANTGDFAGEIARHAARLSPEKIVVLEPGDWRVRETLCAAFPDIEFREDRHFLCSRDAFASFAEKHPSLLLENFYRAMRRRLGILMDGDAPKGGAWNFDKENRGSFGRQGPPLIPPPPRFEPDAVSTAVLEMVEREFPHSPGRLDAFSLPVTRAQARAELDDFVRHRLPDFGRYQDAMHSGQYLLFHSRLSGPLNLHLLTPAEVVQAALQNPAGAPLASVEGFIRQIIGWREFVRGVYWLKMPDYAGLNALGADLPAPRFLWTGHTDMNCLRNAIGHVADHAYAHHIERLMVLGQLCLLLGIKPYDVHRWHMSMFWDAIDWVSLPNTLGMSQHGDGGIVGTKPYAASGAYIDRMSDYCRGCRYDPRKATGEDACPVTTLYWDFLERHKARFASNARMKYQYVNLARKDAGERAMIRARAEVLKKELTSETFL